MRTEENTPTLHQRMGATWCHPTRWRHCAAAVLAPFGLAHPPFWSFSALFGRASPLRHRGALLTWATLGEGNAYAD